MPVVVNVEQVTVSNVRRSLKADRETDPGFFPLPLKPTRLTFPSILRTGEHNRSSIVFFRIFAEKYRRKPMLYISMCPASAKIRHVYAINICQPYTSIRHRPILGIGVEAGRPGEKP